MVGVRVLVVSERPRASESACRGGAASAVACQSSIYLCELINGNIKFMRINLVVLFILYFICEMKYPQEL